MKSPYTLETQIRRDTLELGRWNLCFKTTVRPPNNRFNLVIIFNSGKELIYDRGVTDELNDLNFLLSVNS